MFAVFLGLQYNKRKYATYKRVDFHRRYHCKESPSGFTRQRLTFAAAKVIDVPTWDSQPKRTTPHRSKMILYPRLKSLFSSIKSVHFSHILIYLLFLLSGEILKFWSKLQNDCILDTIQWCAFELDSIYILKSYNNTIVWHANLF